MKPTLKEERYLLTVLTSLSLLQCGRTVNEEGGCWGGVRSCEGYHQGRVSGTPGIKIAVMNTLFQEKQEDKEHTGGLHVV